MNTLLLYQSVSTAITKNIRPSLTTVLAQNFHNTHKMYDNNRQAETLPVIENKFRWTHKVIKPEDVKLHRVYPGDEDKDIPDMDERLLPAFKRLRRMQAIYQRDDGLPIHMKTPWQRFSYRGLWVISWILFIYSISVAIRTVIDS